MKNILRIFKYVRELEEDLAAARLAIATLKSNDIEEQIPSDIGYGSAHNAEQGAFIIYQMKRRGITLDTIAKECGVSFQMVHAVLWGRKTSGRVQKQIAASLGYSSWVELLSARKEVAA